MSTSSENPMPGDRQISVREALAKILANEPPEPVRHRFQPLRLGILGIWQYDEQVFNFLDGRLILLGRNGSGKTKVLEVTSPFLLDAELRPRRLDPFGSSARSMRDNLLYGGRNHQVGYVWCEYGRITEAGNHEYRTIGIGMRAHASKSGQPEPWFFITDTRIGLDGFELYGSGRRPLSHKELKERLGPESVFDTAHAYKQAVAQRLFGMPPERFRSLVELLVTLRRPKLSEDFNVKRLTEILCDGLPPADPAVLGDLARGFDELEREQEGLRDLKVVGDSVDRFLKGYRTYARRMTRHVAAKVRSANTRVKDVNTERNRTEAEHDDLTAEATQLDQTFNELSEAITGQRARVSALERRPEIEQHSALVDLKNRATAAKTDAGRAKEREESAATALAAAELEATKDATAVQDAKSEQEEANTESARKSEDCGLRLEYDLQSERLTAEPNAARAVLETAISARRQAVQRCILLIRAVENAQGEFDKAQHTRDDLVARSESAKEIVGRRQLDLAGEIETATTALVSWQEECGEIQWTDDEFENLLKAVRFAGERGQDSLAELVRNRADSTATVLNSTLVEVQHRRETAIADHKRLKETRAEIAAEIDPPPPPPIVARRDRNSSELTGAPLWRLLEFIEEVPASTRDGVETALLGSGLLDAWVLPDGVVLDPGTNEVILETALSETHPNNLSLVLEPARQDLVNSAVIQRVLKSVSFEDHNIALRGGPSVAADGHWAIGPLQGCADPVPASYIGAAAREAARLRRLHELDTRLTQASAVITELTDELKHWKHRLDRLEADRRGHPDDNLIRAARIRLDDAITAAAEVTAEVRQAEIRLQVKREKLGQSFDALDLHAEAHQLGKTYEDLDTMSIALTEYRDSVGKLFATIDRLQERQSKAQSSQSYRNHLHNEHQLLAEDHHRVSELYIQLSSAYDVRYNNVGASVEEVLAMLEEARSRLKTAEVQRDQAIGSRSAVSERLGAVKSKLTSLEATRLQYEQDRRNAAAEFERLRLHGFLELSLVPTEPITTATLKRSLEDAQMVERHLHEEDISDHGRNSARNLADVRFRELEREISGQDWRPWGNNDGDLFVVKVQHNGADLTVLRLRSIVRDEVESRNSLLDERERKLFNDVLLGRVGEHLRECRAEAASLRERMNMLLEDRPTASGLRMRLIWEADPEAGSDVERALNLLDGHSPAFLTDAARAELVGFLTSRVRQARESDQAGDWREHLYEALDYRRWSRFRLQVRFGDRDRWTDHNDAKHQQGSGGEKAVMLQLPLFVAAAAHYAAAAETAPHPVYLDEAFAGIDTEMRGSCMKLLTDLDLDFVMASHDEWGFHAEVPGLVTYNLYRDPEIHGVLTTPIAWDGTSRHEMKDPAAWSSEYREDTLFDV